MLMRKKGTATLKDSLTLSICLLSFLNVDVFTFGCAGSSLLHRLLSSCGELGLLHSVVCELLIAGASLVAALRLGAAQASVLEGCGLSGCSSWALEHRRSRGTQA